MMIGLSDIEVRWKKHWCGLRNGLTPMLNKEMRSRTRGWRSPVLLSIYLGLLSIGMAAFLWLNLERTSTIFPQVGLSLYSILVFGLVLLLAFIAPSVSASAISGERERRTYDLLLVTKASMTGIVLGKWLASMAYLIFLILAALPLLAVVYLFGGVPISLMLLAVLICFLTGLGYGALGLCLSALLKRSQAATIISLVLVSTLIFGMPMVSGIVAAGNYSGTMNYSVEIYYQPPQTPWYLYMSPLAALTDAIPGAGEISPGQSIPLISSLMNELMNQSQNLAGNTVKYIYTDGSMDVLDQGMTAWPFWTRFALNQVILTLVCLLITRVRLKFP